MENSLSLFVESLNEHWDLPNPLALKWTSYEKEIQASNDEQTHKSWLATLTPEEQLQIIRKKAKD